MGHALLFVTADGRQHPLIVSGDDLFEIGQIFLVIREDLPAQYRGSLLHIVLQDFPQLGNIVVFCQLLQHGHILIHAAVEAVVQIQHIGDASAHAGCKVFARSAKNDGAAAGHIFQTVVTAALRHQGCAGIADAEAFSRDAVEIGLAGRRSKEGDVAHNYILFRLKGAVFVRKDNEFAAGQTLAETVVGVAGQADGNAFGQEGAEGLASASAGIDHKGVVRQGIAEVLGHLGTQDGAEGPVGGRDLQGGFVVSDGPAARLFSEKTAEGRLFLLQISCKGICFFFPC